MPHLILSPSDLRISHQRDGQIQTNSDFNNSGVATDSNSTVSTVCTDQSQPVSLTGSRVSLRASTQPHSHSQPSCGWLCFKPQCLQYALSSRWLLFWLCWAAAIQGMVVNGFVNVCITTIEKRYDLRSTDTGFMATAYDISSVLCSVPVAYLGSRKGASKARWLGVGMLLMGLGSFTFALPHFITPQYNANVVDTSDLNKSVITCNHEAEIQVTCDSPHEGVLSNFKHVFTLGQFLHGVGATPLYTLGVTYLDESVPVRMSSVYLGVYYAMAVVGPAVGYVMGGQFLNIYINAPTEDPSDFSLTPQSDRWLGGWWMGFIVSGCLSFLVAWPLLGFPANLPAHKDEDDIADHKQGHKRSNSTISGPAPGMPSFEHMNDFPSATRSLLSNITFVCLSLAGATEGILLTGFATFMPKFIESQFSVAASFSARMLGFIAVPAGGGGTLLGGWLIKKYHLTCADILKVLVIGSVFCLIACLSMLIYCPSLAFAGIDVTYDGSERVSPTPHLNASCNSKCGCDGVAYNPVCGANNIQYYSPCHAGCLDRMTLSNTEIYTNCSCIATTTLNSAQIHQKLSYLLPEGIINQLTNQDVVIRGKCHSGCNVMPYFLLLCLVLMLLTFSISLPALSGTLRCVDTEQRSLALGVQWIIVRLLGTIPGPIIFGSVIDYSCRLWAKSCDVDGSCLSYNNYSMSRYILGISIAAKSCSTISFVMASYFYRPPRGQTPTPLQTVRGASLSFENPRVRDGGIRGYDNPNVEVT